MAKDTKLLVASTEPVDLDEIKTPNVPKTETETEIETKPEVPLKDEESLKIEVPLKDEEPKIQAPLKIEAPINAKEETENAPPEPARPLSPASRVRKDLQDAFPQIEEKYIQAVLIASSGKPEPAFNALLYILDPTFTPEPFSASFSEPVAKTVTLTDDELLARQLQKEFEKEDRRRHSRRKQAAPVPEDDSPDEFDQLKETFTQGFEEAKTTLNSWVSGLSKKLSPEEQQSPKLFGALGGSSFKNDSRTQKFDEDPEILALDFTRKVDLRGDKPPLLPKRDREREDKWQPLNSDVPVTLDAFLVTDLEDEDKK